MLYGRSHMRTHGSRARNNISTLLRIAVLKITTHKQKLHSIHVYKHFYLLIRVYIY
jgi:hypothetical protein